MHLFSYEFNKNKDLGENFYIYEYSDNSGICTCGHYDEQIEIVTKCPNCGTKAIIEIKCHKPGKDYIEKKYIDNVKFNNNEFNLKMRNIIIRLKFNTTVKNNLPVYKIDKDSLDIKTEDCIDLKFYYTKNKKDKLTLKSEYYIKGEKEPFNSRNYPYLYNTVFLNDQIKNELVKVSIERYASDIWKIYSFYKNAPDLVMNGYINFSASVSEIRKINALLINENSNSIFEDILSQFKYIANTKSTLKYNSFESIYKKEGKENFDVDFIKYILKLDKDLLKELYSKTTDLYYLMNILYELNYNTEEANNFLNLIIRQNCSLYKFDMKMLKIIRLLNEYGIEIEKNPKDIRIFLEKITLISKFNENHYIYNFNIALNYKSLYLKKPSYDDKMEEIIKFLTANNYDFFKTVVELLIETKNLEMDIYLLLKDDKAVKNCLVITDKNDKIFKILYKDETYEKKEDIEDFLTMIENDLELQTV